MTNETLCQMWMRKLIVPLTGSVFWLLPVWYIMTFGATWVFVALKSEEWVRN